MTIRNVNGRNVYVLEPRQPTGKTTSGRNWATLYSELRWQVWEEIQKNEAAMLKMELSSAQMRKDYYDDKIKVLQDQRKQLQAAALKGERGDPGSANRDYLAGARIIQRDEEATSKEIRTKTTPGITVQLKSGPVTTGESIETTQTVREGAGLPGEVREGVLRRMRLMDQQAGLIDQQAGAPAEGAKVAPAGPTIDQQIEALDRDLEQLLLQRQAATSGLDVDLLRRTREGFAEQVGVMGQGGGIFGLAPRPRRTAPFVQQELAQERIDQFTRDREQAINSAALQARQKRSEIERLRGLAAELETIGLGGEGGEADMLYREADQMERTLLTPEQAALAADEEIRQRLLSSEEFTPRRGGELLLRDRPRTLRGEFEPPRMAGQEEVSSPAAMRRAEKILEAIGKGLEPLQGPVPPISEMGPAAPAPVTIPTDEEIVFGPSEVTVEPPAKPEGELPLVEEQRRPLPPLERTFLPEPFPAQLSPEETPLPSGQPVALDEEQAITNPDILDNPDFIPSASLIEKAEDYYRGMTIKRGEDRPRKILAPKRYFGGETQMVKEYLKDQIREQAPVGVDIGQEIEAVEAGPPQGSSRQRKDRYKFDVVTEGTKLARTPKKLQRLAKTNLPEENRPEHYVIVDKLYDVNRGKAEAFKMTYDEISRAFQNDPQKRSDAHKYLVAKDILEADVTEPLA